MARALNVRRMILDEDWWGLVTYVLEVTDPIMAMLRFADSDQLCLGDIHDSMKTMLEKIKMVANSSAAERNWSTYSFIHSVKRNWLAAKKAEDLVFIHNNLRLLSQKDPEYKKGPEKLWDVALETLDLDMTIWDLARSTLLDLDDDEEEYEFTIPSTSSGGGLGSFGDTDLAHAAH